jgi:cell division protein FtsQ
MMRALLLALVPASLLAASYFAWPIRAVTVTGNHHLSREQVLSLAGAEVGTPWLWVIGERAGALAAQPWVARASIIKRFPASIEIRITERQVAARFERPDLGESTLVAWDGTVLPESAQPMIKLTSKPTTKPTSKPTITPAATTSADLPRIIGFGSNRLTEALAIAKATGASEVRYSPSAFVLRFGSHEITSDGLASLQKFQQSVKLMAGLKPSKTAKSIPVRLSVYDWGVSVKQ